ncbi:storkhead-box protein 1 [Macrotis lagotis]|uniref:storkhead-box protein 1 n=1 Tax=Macrotis lagotis TaxID=92651 RepID=UPI003D68A66C
MARPVQLAPGSLALVLCRQERAARPGPAAAAAEDGGSEGRGGPGEPGGRALFRAFRRANARCFWNARLARAASRLAFQGWLRRGVLLVHGPPASLQALRDAWLRRALRPPRGFRIRALGDVFPVQMNPITQSQFIPLAEVLCCAIADMNAAHVVVTQESLMDQLVKHYPGIAAPSQDILYTTLGNLIKERKIYHTGEGYFIVTPQTYFITNTATQEKKRTALDNHPLPPSVTYLVSMDNQAESAKENITSPSHCKSCRCFPDPCPGEGQGVLPEGEGNRKEQKSPGAAKPPLVQSQAVSTSAENCLCDGTKPLLDTKDKEKTKKFGLRLFWRQMSRKERPKKDHRSFSAQFPPEEWPVRDEENLDNIPRDVEHEIIKRINPELTVDNLIKHTVLMQKYEEQKKYTSQGTSTDLLAAGRKQPQPQPQPVKAVGRRRQSRSGRHRRKGHPSRERSRARSRRGSQGSEPRSVFSRPEKHQPAEAVPRVTAPEEGLAQKPLGEPQQGLASPHFIYKKRISNPFLGFSHRGNLATRGSKGQKSSDLKLKQTEKPRKSFQRSRSLDSSRNCDSEAHQPRSQWPKDKGKPAIPFFPENASVQPVGDDFPDRLSNSSQGGFLRTSGEGRPFRESQPGQSTYIGQGHPVPDDRWKIHTYRDPPEETPTETRSHSAPRASCLIDHITPGRGLIDQTIMHQFQNLGLLDECLSGAHPIQQTKRQNRDPSKELTLKCWETLSQENEGFTDDDDHQALYQKEVDGDEDACSSLYLEEEEEQEDFTEKRILCPTRPGHISYPFTDGRRWDNLGKSKVTEGQPGPWKISNDLTDYSSKLRFQPQTSDRNDCHRPAGSLADVDGHQKMNFSGKNRGLGPSGYHCDEETGTVPRPLASSELVDGSIFDYYNASEADSEAETLRNSSGEMGDKSACRALGPQGEEMRKHFRPKPEPFSDPRKQGLTQRVQQEQNHLEGTESHSLTGDSGIDSPRTQSLASSNSVILEGLKRRRSFLQNFEGVNSTRNGQMLTSNSLLQLTPAINV